MTASNLSHPCIKLKREEDLGGGRYRPLDVPYPQLLLQTPSGQQRTIDMTPLELISLIAQAATALRIITEKEAQR